MRFRVVKEGGVNIIGRHLPEGYETEGETLAEAFARYRGGFLRRQNKVIEHIKDVLEALEASGKITITG